MFEIEDSRDRIKQNFSSFKKKLITYDHIMSGKYAIGTERVKKIIIIIIKMQT